MHDTRTFSGTNLFPGYHLMNDTLDGGQFVKGTAILPADHIMAFEGLYDMIIAFVAALKSFQDREQLLSQIIELPILLYFHVLKLRMDRRRHISRQRPGRRCPDQQRGIWLIEQGQSDIEAEMADLFVVLGQGFHIRDARCTARAPGHHIMPFIEQTLLLTLLEERPDCIVILIRERIVVVAPIGPLSQPDRLRCDALGKLPYPLFT